MTESSSSSAFRVPRSAFSSLGWSVYLACSWTWCIGMFLPVLLVRDFGTAGWFAFAIPNVIGAAAFAFFVRDRDASRRLMDRHRLMIETFSAVTIAYQIFFVGSYLREIAGPLAIGLPVLAAACWMLVGRSIASDLRTAVVVLGVSLVALLVFLMLRVPTRYVPIADRSSAWWIMPVCTLGFLLCPYLDATFHRARQNTTAAAGRIAFAVGFGVFFLLMILFSLRYAHRPAAMDRGLYPFAASVIAIHMIVQLAFTIGVHARELQASGGAVSRTFDSPLTLIVVITMLLLLGGWNPEKIYLVFLGFYGLVFPAYVWLCMIPGRNEAYDNVARKIFVWFAVVAVASPMYGMGFIGKIYWWLLPGIAVVLASRLLVSPLPGWRRR